MADNVTVGIILKAGTDKAGDAFKSFGVGVSKAFAVVGVAALAAGAALGAMTKKGIDLADKMFIAADRTGASTEFISQMGFAASQSGASMDTLTRGMIKLSSNAVAGTSAFKKWGVQLKNEDGTIRSTEQLFGAAAERISKLKSGTLQSAAAMDLFGKAGNNLLPVLRANKRGLEEWKKQADDLGVTIDSFSSRLGNEVNNQLGRSKDSFNALAVTLQSVFAPVLIAVLRQYNAVGGAMKKWLEANRELLQSKIAGFLIWMADTAIPAIAVGADLVAKIWLGWKLLFQTLDFAVSKFIEHTLSGFASVASWAAQLADKLGAGGIAASLREIAGTQETVAAGFAKDAEVASGAMAQTLTEINATEEAIGSFGVKAGEVLRSTVAAAQAVTAEFEKLGKTGQEAGDAAGGPLEKVKKTTQGTSDAARRVSEHIAVQTREYERLAKQAALRGELEEANRQKIKAAIDEGVAYGDIIGDAFGQLINGSAKVGEVLKGIGQNALAVIKTKIIAYASEAAAAQFAAYANIPFVGLILGAAAASTAFGLVSALIDRFHDGGEIGPGGRKMPGLGSREHIIAVEEGETVVTRRQRERIEERGSTRGGGGSFTYAPQMLLPATGVDLENHLRREVAPLLMQMGFVRS